MTQHILGIQRFSRHKVRAVPSKFARLVLSKTGLTRYLYQGLMNKIGLNGYDVVHSHVNPWFTNLCLSSRANTCKWIHTYHTLYFDEDYSDGLQSWQKEINRTLIEIASKADVGISVSKWLLFPHHCMCSWCPWQAYYRPAFWLCLSPSSGTSMVSTPGAVASSICKVLGKGITMRGKPIISVIAASVFLAINIPLNMSLIPRMGITRAALASTISYFVAAIVVLVPFLRISGSSSIDTVLLKREDLRIYPAVFSIAHSLNIRDEARRVATQSFSLQSRLLD